MRILLTGASGLVGAAVARRAAVDGHEVTGCVHRFAGHITGLARQVSVDLTDPAAVHEAALAARPEVIINCAAVAEPPACATDPAGSEKLNVQLPAWLAQHAAAHGVRLIHLSSEQVFDGGRYSSYAITDTPRPLNLYGEQKLAGERAVLAAMPTRAVIVRLPLLTGDSANHQRSLHERYFMDWQAGRTPRLYTDEHRQTCSAGEVAAVLVALCARPDIHGLRHWAGADLLTRHEIARRMRAHFRLGETVAPLLAVTRAETPAVSATRPACLALNLEPLRTELARAPQSFAMQLAELTVPPSALAWHQANRTP